VRHQQITCDLALPAGTAAGPWVLEVANPGDKKETTAFTVNAVVPTITGVAPDSGTAGGTTGNVVISGANFDPAAEVNLKKAEQTPIVAVIVSRESHTGITCRFDLTGAAAGKWDVEVVNPGNKVKTLAEGFTVEEAP